MQAENWQEIGEAHIKYCEHLRAELVYPKLREGACRFLIVPLDIIIAKDGQLETVEYSKTPTEINPKYQYTNDQQFVDEAIKVVRNFNEWMPKKIDGQYQQTKRYLGISFFYHQKTLSDPRVILNPTTRAKYRNKTSAYEYSIEGRRGCDGLGLLLAIIDETGQPERIECLEAHGKTNCEVLEREFLELGKWEPAIFQGVKVKSQICLSIYA